MGVRILTAKSVTKNRPHINVGTIGRMLDHINRHTLKLSTVNSGLDEADEMLNMGFLEDIEAIISKVPNNVKRYYSQQRCHQKSKISVCNSCKIQNMYGLNQRNDC